MSDEANSMQIIYLGKGWTTCNNLQFCSFVFAKFLGATLSLLKSTFAKVAERCSGLHFALESNQLYFTIPPNTLKGRRQKAAKRTCGYLCQLQQIAKLKQ